VAGLEVKISLQCQHGTCPESVIFEERRVAGEWLEVARRYCQVHAQGRGPAEILQMSDYYRDADGNVQKRGDQ
jgi:hypothetical protein